MSPLLLRGDESVCEVDALFCVVFQLTSGIGGAEGSVTVCMDDDFVEGKGLRRETDSADRLEGVSNVEY